MQYKFPLKTAACQGHHLSYEAIEYKKNTMTGLHKLCACLIYTTPSDNRDRRGRDHMVVGFITTYPLKTAACQGLLRCYIYITPSDNSGCRGRDRMVVGFITTYICNKCLSPLTL
jgi:hypothetical protein